MPNRFIPITIFVLGLLLGLLLGGQALLQTTFESMQTAWQHWHTPSALTATGSTFDATLLGPPDAPIHLVEYGDYACAYCAQWHFEVLPALLAQYPTQIQYEYRPFPQPALHPEAWQAAEAALCAEKQDMFWDFHEGLFGNGYRLSEALYLELAGMLGLDLNSFAQCLRSGDMTAQVQHSFEEGTALGLYATPTFFLNGQRLIGSQDLATLQTIIDSLLETTP